MGKNDQKKCKCLHVKIIIKINYIFVTGPFGMNNKNISKCYVCVTGVSVVEIVK